MKTLRSSGEDDNIPPEIIVLKQITTDKKSKPHDIVLFPNTTESNGGNHLDVLITSKNNN